MDNSAATNIPREGPPPAWYYFAMKATPKALVIITCSTLLVIVLAYIAYIAYTEVVRFDTCYDPRTNTVHDVNPKRLYLPFGQPGVDVTVYEFDDQGNPERFPPARLTLDEFYKARTNQDQRRPAMATKIRWVFPLAPLLLASNLWAQGDAPNNAGSGNTGHEFGGCICGVDEVKANLKVVAWNNDKKVWDTANTRVFVYQDWTIIKGVNAVTVAELKSGKTVKSYHFQGIQNGRPVGTPFEIKRLSECVGHRTTLSWADDNGSSVAKQILLTVLFAGESMPE